MRDLVDEEEEEEVEDESEGEESEDEDFVPNPLSEDESDGDEGVYDDDVAEVGDGGGGTKPKAAGTKRAAKAKPAQKKAKRPRGGGLANEVLSDEEGEVGAASTSAAAPSSEPEPEPAPEPVAAPAKSSVDDLWASMKADVPKRAPPKAPVAAAAGGAGPSGGGGGKGGGSLDIKALLAKAGTGTKSTVGLGEVEITVDVDFCGEIVTQTKKVKVGSKEHIAFQQRGLASTPSGAYAVGDGVSKGEAIAAAAKAATALQRQMSGGGLSAASSSSAMRFDSSLEFKEALPPPKLPGSTPKPTGLQGLLATLDGKKKMSTMEKSRHDWGQFKAGADEHTRDEMEKFAKDGYLAKQAFLQRTDVRQAEVARSNRRRGMGMKD
jgi:hypothetical protein